MSDGLNQLPPDVIVYRRFHSSHFFAGQPVPILPDAFRPNPNDTDGLSVFCATEISVDDLVNSGRKPADEYGVAELQVRDLNDLELSVVRDDSVGAPSGHALIPELSWPEYQQNKRRLKAIQLELAKLARRSIVRFPRP